MVDERAYDSEFTSDTAEERDDQYTVCFVNWD